MIKITFSVFFFAICILPFFLPKHVAAAGEHLVINEIYPNPKTGESEWIELFNPTASDISLDNYSIEDGTHVPKVLSGYNMPASQYLILEKGTDFSFGLNNDGDLLELKENSVLVDSVCYGNFDDGDKLNNAPVPDKGKSISRVPNGFDSDNDLSDFKVTILTKGLPYEKQTYSSDIIISEIVPTPANGAENEYIELYNQGNISVELIDWQIDDGEGGSAAFTIPDSTTIQSGQYLAFYNSETHISLNDDGDSARLLDPNGDIESTTSYTKGEEGESYGLFSDGWSWSTTLTPGAANILTVTAEDDSSENVSTILAAREKENGTVVTVLGTVTVLPDALSSQYFYVQDATSGIQIYCYDKDFPVLNLGDVIRISGEMSEIAGERRIKIKTKADIVIQNHTSPPPPKEVEIAQVNENLEGQLVSVEGRVSKTSGDNFTLESESGGSIKVLIRPKTGINKPRMKKGDLVEVRGVVSQYKDEYRILPIDQDDVKIIASDHLPLAGPEVNYFIVSGIIFIIWNLLAIAKKKLRNLLKSLLYKAKAVIFTHCKAIWEAARLFSPRILPLV